MGFSTEGADWAEVADQRLFDEDILKEGAVIGQEVAFSVQAKLRSQEVFTIGALLGTCDKADGEASLMVDRFTKGIRWGFDALHRKGEGGAR